MYSDDTDIICGTILPRIPTPCFLQEHGSFERKRNNGNTCEESQNKEKEEKKTKKKKKKKQQQKKNKKKKQHRVESRVIVRKGTN